MEAAASRRSASSIPWATSAGTFDLTSAKLHDGFVAKKAPTTTAPAARSHLLNLLLADAPTRRLRGAAVDSALADLGDDDSTVWDDAFDDEQLLKLASTPALRGAI